MLTPSQRKGGFTALSKSQNTASQTIFVRRCCSKRNTRSRSLSVVGDSQAPVNASIDWNTQLELRGGDLSLWYHTISGKGTSVLSDHPPGELMAQIRDGSMLAIERFLEPFDVFHGHPLLDMLFWGFIVVNLYVFIILTPRQ